MINRSPTFHISQKYKYIKRNDKVLYHFTHGFGLVQLK